MTISLYHVIDFFNGQRCEWLDVTGQRNVINWLPTIDMRHPLGLGSVLVGPRCEAGGVEYGCRS